MTAIDQKTLLAPVGPGLSLAGLSDRVESLKLSGQSGDEGEDEGGEETGSGPLWGHSVTTAKASSDELAFDPEYVCALYIRYESNGRPSIRHAYKALVAPKTDDIIRDTAEYILKDLRDDKYHADIVHVRRNFRQFTMNCQQVLVIFLDNDPAIIRLNDDPEMENLVRFTAFGGVPPYSERKQNFAFFNLQRIRWDKDKDEFDCNTAYRLDFWNTDETGALLEIDADTPEEDRYIYSMNIHMLQAPYEPDEVAVIPVILDPDTGNGGAEP